VLRSDSTHSSGCSQPDTSQLTKCAALHAAAAHAVPSLPLPLLLLLLLLVLCAR
jgi:hypothetical protein